MASVHSSTVSPHSLLPSISKPKSPLTKSIAKLPNLPRFPRSQIFSGSKLTVVTTNAAAEDLNVITVQSEDITEQQEGVVVVEGGDSELATKVSGFGANEGLLSLEGFPSTSLVGNENKETMEKLQTLSSNSNFQHSNSNFLEPHSPLELANSQFSVAAVDSSQKKLVLTLYEALNNRDSDTVVKIVASDLEWWFHGPPSHQFLMRMLTGDKTGDDSFRFVPQSLASFGSIVVVEGCDTSRAISWVHALTIADGIVTQVREYFNTSLTVTRISDSGEIVPAASSSGRFACVWESSVSDRVGKSVPGLVLAI